MRSKVYLFIAITSCFIICCRKYKQGDILADSDITWKKTWGSELLETTRSLVVAQDGSVVVMGTASSNSDTFSFSSTYSWIVNFDSEGDKKWETLLKNDTTFSGVNTITVSSDGGYALAGTIQQQYNTLGQIIKLDSHGEIIWQNYFDGDSPPEISQSVSSVAAMPDGGYIVAGGAFAFYSGGGVDYWIVKLNSNGEKDWDRTFGEDDGIFSNLSSTGASGVAATADGGCIVVGSVLTNIFSYFQGNSDFLIIKLDSHGEIVWKKAFGGSEQEDAISVAVTQDGGYIIAGTASSQDGDVQGVRVGAFNYNDLWVLKLDELGQIVWQKTLGGFEDDKATSVAVTPDGGYIVAGTTSSNSGDVTGNHGYSDCWIVKLDSQGEIIWQKALGGYNVDEGTSVAVSPTGGYIVAGTTWSNDGDVSGNSGLSDAFIVKINK